MGSQLNGNELVSSGEILHFSVKEKENEKSWQQNVGAGDCSQLFYCPVWNHLRNHYEVGRRTQEIGISMSLSPNCAKARSIAHLTPSTMRHWFLFLLSVFVPFPYISACLSHRPVSTSTPGQSLYTSLAQKGYPNMAFLSVLPSWLGSCHGCCWIYHSIRLTNINR